MWKPVLPLVILASVGSVSVAAAADGKALYEDKCTMCHDKDGVAKKMGEGSANFNDPKWQAANSTEAIAEVIAEGKNKMKRYEGKLSAEEIAAIATYVKTLK